jgi:hypothetical protein
MRNAIVSALHNLELACQRFPRLCTFVHNLKFSRAVMGGSYESLSAFYNRH